MEVGVCRIHLTSGSFLLCETILHEIIYDTSKFLLGLLPWYFSFVFLANFQSYPSLPNVVCSLCEKTFSDANSAKDHERQVHKEENVSCAVCGKWETNIYTLMGHMQNHETKLCDICSEY